MHRPHASPYRPGTVYLIIRYDRPIHRAEGDYDEDEGVYLGSSPRASIRFLASSNAHGKDVPCVGLVNADDCCERDTAKEAPVVDEPER